MTVSTVRSTQSLMELHVYVKMDGPETAVKYLREHVMTYVLHALATQSYTVLTALKMLIMTLPQVPTRENAYVIHAGKDQTAKPSNPSAAVVNVVVLTEPI